MRRRLCREAWAGPGFSPVAEFYYKFYGSAATGTAAASRHESSGPAGEARCEAQQSGEEEEKEHESAEDDAFVDRPPVGKRQMSELDLRWVRDGHADEAYIQLGLNDMEDQLEQRASSARTVHAQRASDARAEHEQWGISAQGMRGEMVMRTRPTVLQLGLNDIGGPAAAVGKQYATSARAVHVWRASGAQAEHERRGSSAQGVREQGASSARAVRKRPRGCA
jgi:hypothetical protein